jgi:vacuolar-type H+-ATPase subunit H
MAIKGLGKFDDLEDRISEAIAKYEKATDKASIKVLEEVQELLSDLKKQGALFARSKENLQIINKLNSRIQAIIAESGYYTGVSELLAEYNQSSTLINAYFAINFKDFNPATATYKQLTNFFIEKTANEIADIVNGDVVADIKKILRDSVENGVNSVRTKTLLKEYFADNQKLIKYTKTIATDSLNQYAANYTLGIAEDLDLQHYYYRGTKIATSRQFCNYRAGKYFTKKEIQDWANLNWAGKNPATNKDNIFTLRGGFSCRHQFIPVSEEVYNARVNNATQTAV